MACSQTLAGIAFDCAASAGGVKAIWLANFVDVTLTTSNGEVSAIAMEGTAKFKKYAFRAETAYANSDYQSDPVAGSSYWQSDIYMQFTKKETAKRMEIAAIAVAGLVAIVEDNNGAKWVYGINRPVYTSGANATTGTALGDRNGYSVNLIAKDNEPAMALSSSVTIPE